ncbi:uncharacterized protein IL334_006379 [Kwoniella shivajii]|uniref:Sensor domain-containing protein n=1 Tax=Kwoniella shivajii TaxID=564305 RepID=A0ABZ1D7P0_9TREE|nr:hypothetical protein IL334_006379 [Kwoniella shivajii]
MSQSLHLPSPSNPTSPLPKPPRLLPRSPSEPLGLSGHSNLHASGGASGAGGRGGGNASNRNQPIYVLTADGSSLFLLDPSKPRGGEEPPPYASFPISPNANTIANANPNIEDVTTHSIAHGHENDRGRTQSHHDNTNNSNNENGHSRNRARTLSALNTNTNTNTSINTNIDNRPRYSSSQSYNNHHNNRRTRSIISNRTTPEFHTNHMMPDENTPLLPTMSPSSLIMASGSGNAVMQEKKRGLWRSVWCGDLDIEEEDQYYPGGGGWKIGFKRFWRPLRRSVYWRSVSHLIFLNFPFALFVWPFLVAGTLAGTALLITLPLGAAVWWLTLFISRSAARLESIMQLSYHSPLTPASPPSYHPIFYRLVPRSPPPSPLSSPTSPWPETPGNETPPPPHDTAETETGTDPATLALASSGILGPSGEILIWEKRFMKCSYAMFGDHYSYSALSYFLLIKPIITLFSTIVIIVLLPIGVGTIIGLPIYFRLMRRWGKWQAEVAIENL